MSLKIDCSEGLKDLRKMLMAKFTHLVEDSVDKSFLRRFVNFLKFSSILCSVEVC